MAKTVIVLVGPTAAGKSAVAIELAIHFQTEIISADSRQCFKELKIGVARPSIPELERIPHHFIASHSIHEEMNAAIFEQYALEKASELFQHNDYIVMTGGTGLYIKAFCEGLDSIPAVDSTVRETIVKRYEEQGLEWLQKELQQKDAVFYANGEMKNPQRMMRALEVVEATGQSILSFRREKEERNFNIIKIGLQLPKEELERNIRTRVDAMINEGLVEEVRGLLPNKNLNALRTVGYAEMVDYLEERIALPAAIEKIKTNTRQYARRQMTWFRRDTNIKWQSPSALNDMIRLISDKSITN